MQKRVARLGLVALLLVVGAVAAFVTWDGERDIQALDDERRARDAVVERLSPALSGIAAAQQAYADYGHRDAAAFARVSALTGGLATDAAALPSSQSAGDAVHLEEFWTALSALRAADAQAQQSLAAGEPLTAADAIFADARPQVVTLDAALDAYRQAATDQYQAARTALVRRSWLTLGGTAAVWAVGLLALARMPRIGEIPAEPPTREMPGHASLAIGPSEIDVPSQPAPPASLSIDLAATADVCAGLARLTDSAAMPPLLSRAAAILGARGIIIWMGAGDDLYPAAAHGYDAAVLARVRPIRRADDNATAAAWRDGSVRTVASAGGDPGAVVAPIAGADGCIGVLAAEVFAGREDDRATQAVALILASQLATVLAAWPAASGAAPCADTGDPSDSDRKAAAS